jgi:hypothetical protein
MTSNVVGSVKRLYRSAASRETIARTSLTNLKRIPMLDTLRKILA